MARLATLQISGKFQNCFSNITASAWPRTKSTDRLSNLHTISMIDVSYRPASRQSVPSSASKLQSLQSCRRGYSTEAATIYLLNLCSVCWQWISDDNRPESLDWLEHRLWLQFSVARFWFNKKSRNSQSCQRTIVQQTREQRFKADEGNDYRKCIARSMVAPTTAIPFYLEQQNWISRDSKECNTHCTHRYQLETVVEYSNNTSSCYNSNDWK